MKTDKEKLKEIKEFVDTHRTATEEEMQWAQSTPIEHQELIVNAIRQKLVLLEELTDLIEKE